MRSNKTTNKHIHLESFQVRLNLVNIKDRMGQMGHIASHPQFVGLGLRTLIKLIMHRQENVTLSI